MTRKFVGVIAAVPTPYTCEGTPDVEMFLEHCLWAVNNGCDGLNILGTTGEANSIDLATREVIMRAAAETDFGDKQLMVGTGTPSLVDTIKLTILADELGFEGALVLPPYYYKPVTEEGLFRYFSGVINAVKDKNIGIYLYNFPQLTGLEFSVELIARLLEAFPSQLKGMKDSSGNLDYARKIANAFKGRFEVFPSSEGALPRAKKDGFAGCISASVNMTAPYAAKVWLGGDSLTEADCSELIKLREDISAVPIVAAVKELVATRTGNKSWKKLAPPLVELSDEQIEKLKGVADKLGY